MAKPRANLATTFGGQIQQRPVEITVQFQKMPNHHLMFTLTEFLPHFGPIAVSPLVNYSAKPTIRISYKHKDDAFRCKRVLDKIGEILKDDGMSTTFSITNAENDDISMLDTLFKLSTFANVQDAAERFIVQLKRAGYPVVFSNDVNPDVIDTDTEKSVVSIDTTSNQDSDSSTAIKDFNPLTVMIRIRYLPPQITKKQFSERLQKITTRKLDIKFESTKYRSIGKVGLVTFESEEEAFKVTQLLSSYKISDKTIDVQFIANNKRIQYLKTAFAEYQLRNKTSEENKSVFQELFTVVDEDNETLDEKGQKVVLNTKEIYISRIPRSVDQARIKEIFENFGRIKTLGEREYSRKGNWHMTIQYELDESTFIAVAAMNRYKLDGQKLDVVLGPHNAQSQKDALKDWMIDFKLAVNHPYKILMTTTELQKNLKKLCKVMGNKRFGQASAKNECPIQFNCPNTIISKQVLLTAINKVGLKICDWDEDKDEDDEKMKLFVKFSSETDGLCCYHAANLMQSNVLFTSCSWSTRSEVEKNKRLDKLYRIFENFLGRFASEKSISSSITKKPSASLHTSELESDTNSIEDSSRRSSMLSNASADSTDVWRYSNSNNSETSTIKHIKDRTQSNNRTTTDMNHGVTENLQRLSLTDVNHDSSSYESSASIQRKTNHKLTSKRRNMERDTLHLHQVSDTNISNDDSPSLRNNLLRKDMTLSDVRNDGYGKGDPADRNTAYSNYNSSSTSDSSQKSGMVLLLTSTWCKDGCSFWGKLNTDILSLSDIIDSIYPSKCWKKVRRDEIKIGRIYGALTNKLHRVRLLAIDATATVAFIDSDGSIQNVNLKALYRLPEYLHYTQSGPYPFKLYGIDTSDLSSGIESKNHLVKLLSTATHLYAIVVDEKFTNQIEVIVYIPDNLEESLNEQVSKSRYAYLSVENQQFIRNILIAKERVKAFAKLQSKLVQKDQSKITSILNTETTDSNFSPKADVKVLDDGAIGSSNDFDDRDDSVTIAEICNDNRNDQNVVTGHDMKKIVTTLKYEEIIISATLNIIITDVVSPNYFIIKSVEPDQDMQRIKEIRDVMDNRYSKNVPSISINKLLCGKAYAAYFMSHWRRIIIDTIGDTNADVHCVDDGIMETIDLNNIKPLFKSVSQIPATAYPCSLNGIAHQDDNECWNPDVIDRFKELTEGNSLKAKIVIRDESGYRIDLFVNNGNGLDNINQALIADNLCKLSWDSYNSLYKIHNYENMLNNSLLRINQYNQISKKELIPVAITNVVNPGLFWLRRCDDVGLKNEENLERMMVPTMTSQDTSIAVGSTYFVSCTTTYKWYRGLVMKLLPNDQAAVFDIDNGTIDCVNYSDIGSKYNLNDMTPPLAIKCCLYNCKGTFKDGKWNKKSISFFKELATFGNLKAMVVSTSDDGTNCVKLHVLYETKITQIGYTLIKQGCATLIYDNGEDNDDDRDGATVSYTTSNQRQFHGLAGLRRYNPYT